VTRTNTPRAARLLAVLNDSTMVIRSAIRRSTKGSSVRIRPVEERDFPALQDIEHATAEQFRSAGIDAIADLGPFDDEELTDFVRAGRAWVAVGDDDQPLGFLVTDVVDDCLYIAEVDVHPRHARRGIGRQLIEHATTGGHSALILTTFRDVPWNAPYYQRLGFVILADDKVPPGLRAIREYQATIGLDRWPRVCMRRDLVAM
jgi:ribosomal protein S18 acetylase RimI-like enzyme